MKPADVIWIVVILLILFLNWTSGSTQIIPERGDVYYFNERFLSNATVNIKRNSRRSPYYINIEGTTVVFVGDNVSLHGVFYEFLHNEYKRSFVEMDLKLCDLTNKSPWKEFIGGPLAAHGFICPAPPATYRLHNLTVSMDNFPYVWPFEKVMFQGQAMFIPTQEVIVRARFYVTMKRNLPKKG